MRQALRRTLWLLWLITLAIAAWPVLAQVTPELAGKISSAGRVLDPRAAAAMYASLQQREPYAGVQVSRDIAYGESPAQQLDLFIPEGAPSAPRPVLMFVHGGGFRFDDKHRAGSPFYDNLMLWAARQGFIGVNINFRTGPQNAWPTSTEDVAAAVRWVRTNMAAKGGDPERIYLSGHSSGAALVASWLGHPRFHAAPGGGVAGVVLISGYAYELGGVDDPTFSIYYGTDTGLYAERSPLPGLSKSQVPVFLAYAELDLVEEEQQALGLRDALCKASRCPTVARIEGHNHLTQVFAVNTGDESLTKPLLAFLLAAHRGR